MATASELIADVRRIIRDESYSDTTILGFINDGITEIASWENDDPKMGPVGRILLPALETSGTVVTSTANAYVDLPDDYLRELYRVTFEGQTSPVNILSNMRVLLDEQNDGLDKTGGVIEDVTIMGGRLYYQPIPDTATTLTLWYYGAPTLLANYDPDNVDDTPTCIPTSFQKSLLVNYAAKEIYDEIEDGVDGQKINTLRYDSKYQQALAALYRSIKHKSKQVPFVRRHANFF